MPQQPVDVQVCFKADDLADAIHRATAAFETLRHSWREGEIMDELRDEITRLRQECNSKAEELEKARQELSDLRKKWKEAWQPLTPGTAVSTIPLTTGTYTPPPYVFGTATAGVWPAPVTGSYTVTMDGTGFTSATGLPATMTIGSGATSETFTVSNVTFDGIKIAPLAPDPAPHAIEIPREWTWKIDPDGFWNQQIALGPASPTGSEASPREDEKTPDLP